MATFKHIPTGKRFLFVHIPRTAGRFFEQNLMKGNDFVWDDDVEIDRQYKSIDGVELAHFHREYYDKETHAKNKLDKTAKLVNNIIGLYRNTDIEQLYPELATPLEEGT